MTASRPWSSLAFRLALSFGALMVLTMTIVLAVFYVQTVGVVRVRLDKQAENHLRRLMEHSAKYGPGALESEILQTIRDVAAAGMTCIIVTHELRFAREIADRIHVLVDGRIVESGSPAKIFQQPATAETRRFLDKML